MGRRLALLAVVALVGIAWALASTAPEEPAVAPPASAPPSPPPPPEAAPDAAVDFGRAFCPPERLPEFRSRFTGERVVGDVLRDGGVWLHAELPAGPETDARLARNEEPVFALAKGLTHALDPNVDESLAALRAFLSAHDDPAVRALVARLEVARDIRKDYVVEVADGGLTLVVPPSVTPAERARRLERTAATLDEAATWLGAPRRRGLTLVLYPSRSELLAVSCHPLWTGGFYDGSVALLVTSPERAHRHELLHATLATLGFSAPIWFEEGAAQTFERKPPDAVTWRQLVTSRTWIPFDSLERSLGEFDTADARLAYAQSHAMVLFLERCAGSGGLVTAAHLATSRQRLDAIFTRVCGQPLSGPELLDFMQRTLSALPPATPTTPN
ncbi:MAG: hypothetical protein U0228_06250 [Myxococcaceae bacterium]